MFHFLSSFVYGLYFQSEGFKKTAPTQEHCTLLALEVLYLWNAIPAVAKSDLNKMIDGKYHKSSWIVLCLVLQNVCHSKGTTWLPLNKSKLYITQKGQVIHPSKTASCLSLKLFCSTISLSLHLSCRQRVNFAQYFPFTGPTDFRWRKCTVKHTAKLWKKWMNLS